MHSLRKGELLLELCLPSPDSGSDSAYVRGVASPLPSSSPVQPSNIRSSRSSSLSRVRSNSGSLSLSDDISSSIGGSLGSGSSPRAGSRRSSATGDPSQNTAVSYDSDSESESDLSRATVAVVGHEGELSPSEANSPPFRRRSSSTTTAPGGNASQSPSRPRGYHIPRIVQFSTEGNIVFYSVVKYSGQESKQLCLSVCSVNGRHWRTVTVSDHIHALAVSNDGQLMVTGGDSGEVLIRRLHDLKIVQRFEKVSVGSAHTLPKPSGVASDPIRSVTFSAEQDYVIAGTQSGHLLIYAVHAKT